MNVSYLKELLKNVDIEKMCEEIELNTKYLNMCLGLYEVIDSTSLFNVMNYLELNSEQKIKLCTFKNDKNLYAFGVNI